MKKIALIIVGLCFLSGVAQAQPLVKTRLGILINIDRDNNPPGRIGGPGTNWENPPGPRGGRGTSPDRRWRRDRDNNPPGRIGGRGTNWENPPGPRGGRGASPNRRFGRR